MPDYTFYIIANDKLGYNSTTGEFDFAADYDYSVDRYRVVVTDDDGSMEATGDSNQTALIYDMDDNLIDSGPITVPQFAAIATPGGGTEYLDRIVVDGQHYGYLPSADLVPGTSYPVTESSTDTMPHTYFETNSVPCFAVGILIDTPSGPRPIETLVVGDLVQTNDNGPQPVIWAGSRHVTRAQALMQPNLRPIRFLGGLRGLETPTLPLILSQNHRILIDDPAAALLFSDPQVFAFAQHLAKTHVPASDFDWCHILLPNHDIICANGVYVESLFAGDMLSDILPELDFDDLRAALGDLAHQQTARPTLKAYETAVLLNALPHLAQTRNIRVA